MSPYMQKAWDSSGSRESPVEVLSVINFSLEGRGYGLTISFPLPKTASGADQTTNEVHGK